MDITLRCVPNDASVLRAISQMDDLIDFISHETYRENDILRIYRVIHIFSQLADSIIGETEYQSLNINVPEYDEVQLNELLDKIELCINKFFRRT